MVIVLVVVVLAVVGAGVAFALSRGRGDVEEGYVDIDDRLSGSGTPSARRAAASGEEEADGEDADAPTVDEAKGDEAKDEPAKGDEAKDEPAKGDEAEDDEAEDGEADATTADAPAAEVEAPDDGAAEEPGAATAEGDEAEDDEAGEAATEDESSAPSAPEPAPAVAETAKGDEGDDEDLDDEPDLSRFGIPTDKPKVDIPWPTSAPVRAAPPLEAGATDADEGDDGGRPAVVGSATTSDDEPVEGSPDPADEGAPADEVPAAAVTEAPGGGAAAEDDAAAPAAAAADNEVIDLVEAEAGPQPEADPVDLVLQALVDRARERQVGVAEVAAELVDQAQLEDREVDEVLADLVDHQHADERPDSELTFFNDAVPRRPGELSQFATLPNREKKRVIIRVLCLLVAKAEEAKRLPGEGDPEDGDADGWPLARTAWPVSVDEPLPVVETALPARSGSRR